MKKLIVLLLLAGCATSFNQRGSTLLELNDGSMGSGIVLGPNKVLTAAHIKGGACSIMGQPTTLLRIDEKEDLALLKTDYTFSEWLTLAQEPPKIGDEVYVVGYLYSRIQEKSIKHMTFGRVTKIEDGKIWADIKIAPGMSGAPFLNKEGKVVGMVQQFYTYNFPQIVPLIQSPLIQLFGIGSTAQVIKKFLEGI